MKAGQTVAATIPAAVIAIALFRLPFFRGGVLEQNLTRTAASVGEALVAGAIFTIPAFMMVNVGGVRLWQDLRNHYWVGTLILLAGGLLGIGYIIGPRLAAINFSGGVIAWLLLIPLVLFIDPDLAARLGATTGGRAPWDLMSYTVWYNVVRPIAVGAMLVGTVYTLYSMRESILRSIRGAFEASAKGDAGRAARTRLDIDIPIKWIIVAIAALVIPITIIYYHFAGSWSAAILAALVMTVTGFF